MRTIVLDCEFNQPSGKLIELGALAFDPLSGEIIETLSVFVNPGEELNPEIQELCGISETDLATGLSAKKAALKLTELKQKTLASPFVLVWGAGKSNDLKEVYTQSEEESPFRESIIDCKGAYRLLANVSRAEMRSKVGLKTALELLGLGWDDRFGQPHRALADAHNTMRMAVYLSRALKGAHDLTKIQTGLK